jgi:2-phospho-L-lactate/phosphoenolpyruvate guanylyltransferase
VSVGGTGISLVVLAKDTRVAKTRLPLSRADARELALALAAGVVRAGLEATTVGSVLVVTSDPDIAGDALAAGALVVAEHRPRGMDRAAALGRRRALTSRPGEPVAVVVADLPDLTAVDLDEVVREFLAVGGPVFVPDHDGTGTTFVAHGPGRWPGVAFGAGSAARHEQLGYRRAERSPWSLRWDLDTADDLASRDHLPLEPTRRAGP